MKGKAILATVVSVLLLIAVIAAGLNAVFTVTLVRAEFDVFSAEGQADSETLKESLDGYVGSNITFLKLDKLRAEVEKYPCFRVEVLEKKLPSTVSIRVSERKEMFAVASKNGYAILDEEGRYLYDRAENINRAGGENILLEGFAPELKVGEAASGTLLSELFALYGEFSEVLGEVRANVKSVTCTVGEVNSVFFISMQEGIRIEIVNPQNNTREKARAALCDSTDGYLARSNAELTYGTIGVTDNMTGDGVNVVYNPSRNLD